MAKIESGATSDLLTIDPISKAARVALYDASGNAINIKENDKPSQIAGLAMFGANDGSMLPARMDRLGNLGSMLHQPLFLDSFEGTTINPIRWTISANTMGATQASVSGILFNSGAITTLNTGFMLKTNRAFIKNQRQPLQMKIRLRGELYNNAVGELGFGDAATINGANTTGAYWQYTSGGALVPVLTYNGVDITGSDVRISVDNNKFYTFDIVVDDDSATFTIQDSFTNNILSKQVIELPTTYQRLLSSSQIYGMVRLYITGVATATAPKLQLTDVYVAGLDSNYNLPAAHTFAAMHRSLVDNPLTGAQAAQWANSAEPANATLSNTAAGYTTLGGKFQFVAVAGAATDYALFGFQVPVPTTFLITGIKIDSWVVGAAIATTPTLLTWGVKINLTAVSLATAVGNTTPLGVQVLPIGAVIGTPASPVERRFQTPLICGPGRFIDIVLRMPIATATASSVIAGMISIEGFAI